MMLVVFVALVVIPREDLVLPTGPFGVCFAGLTAPSLRAPRTPVECPVFSSLSPVNVRFSPLNWKRLSALWSWFSCNLALSLMLLLSRKLVNHFLRKPYQPLARVEACCVVIHPLRSHPSPSTPRTPGFRNNSVYR